MPNTRQILIVDDDPELRHALTEQLSLLEEFEAVAAEDGSKGPPRRDKRLIRNLRPALGSFDEGLELANLRAIPRPRPLAHLCRVPQCRKRISTLIALGELVSPTVPAPFCAAHLTFQFQSDADDSQKPPASQSSQGTGARSAKRAGPYPARPEM
jgi:hypothetical protein